MYRVLGVPDTRYREARLVRMFNARYGKLLQSEDEILRNVKVSVVIGI